MNRYRNLPKHLILLMLGALLVIGPAGCNYPMPVGATPTSTPQPTATVEPPTETSAPTDTPAPSETPQPSETIAPTQALPAPTDPPAPTATKKKQYTVIIGEETSLGSNSENSKVAVYITGGRVMVYAKGFKANVTLSVRLSSKGKWTELGKVRVAKNSEQTVSVDLPTSLYSVTPITICLKSMKSSEQNCYSVPNPMAP